MTQSHVDRLHRWFKKYLSEFCNGDGASWPALVQLKIDHSLRVAGEARNIAAELGWDVAGQCVAEAAGLLHDVGRFPQYQQYGTFSDARSVDHAECGYNFLVEQDLLTELDAATRARLLSAVRLHNRRCLPADLPASTWALAALIRDADKLDILYVVQAAISSGDIHQHPEILLDVPLNAPLNPEVITAVAARQPVPYSLLQSMADFRLAQLGWIYDINYQPALRRLCDRAYVAEICSFLAGHDAAQPTVAAVQQYLAERLAGRVPAPSQ